MYATLCWLESSWISLDIITPKNKKMRTNFELKEFLWFDFWFTNLTLVVDWFFRFNENRHGTLWKVENSFIKESGTAQGSIGIAFNAESVLAWNRCAWNLFLKVHVLIYFFVCYCYDFISEYGKHTLMRRVSGMPGLHSCVAEPMSTPLRKMEARTESVMGELKIETATR